MRASAAQFVNPGEEIQVVLAAQTGSPLVRGIANGFGLIGALLAVSFTQYRIVAVTGQRILVLDTGRWSLRNARAVIAEMPRATMLGPAKGVWRGIETPAGKVWVHRRFFKDIAAADLAVAPVGY
jgi:hypothetical protein